MLSTLLALCEGNPPITGWAICRVSGNLRRHDMHVTLVMGMRSRALQKGVRVSLHRPLWHDNVIKWKHFPRYWPFAWGIHRSPVNSPHKGQWRGALTFSLICVRINSWVNNREAGDLRRHRAHYDVTVMITAKETKHSMYYQFFISP